MKKVNTIFSTTEPHLAKNDHLFVCLLSVKRRSLHSIFVSQSARVVSISFAHCQCVYISTLNVQQRQQQQKSARIFRVSIEFRFIYICVIVTDVPMTIRKKRRQFAVTRIRPRKKTHTYILLHELPNYHYFTCTFSMVFFYCVSFFP